MNPYLTLIRPRQWFKNLFVLVGVFFSGQFTDPQTLLAALSLVLAFTLGSGAVYVFNDLVDAGVDRLHPRKQHRPIASGQISRTAALVYAAALCLVSAIIAAWISTSSLIIIATYFVLNLAYTLSLKHIPVLDVFAIAGGFLLRVLIGTVGLGITPSNWLLLCTLMLTLFLGFAKRFSEKQLATDSGSGRRVLERYSTRFLRGAMTLTAGGTIIAYVLYTVSPETIERQNTGNLIFTAIPVIYGIGRYFFLIVTQRTQDDAATSFLQDRSLQLTAVAWIALFWAVQSRAY